MSKPLLTKSVKLTAMSERQRLSAKLAVNPMTRFSGL